MSGGFVNVPPSAGRQPPTGGGTNYYKLVDCEEIESAVRLIPPALVDKLCKGERLPPVSGDAIFVEELLEIARKLNRMHLVIIVKDDP